MIKIKNINDRNGDAIEFTAPTLEGAIEEMKKTLRDCGYSDEIQEGVDFEVIND